MKVASRLATREDLEKEGWSFAEGFNPAVLQVFRRRVMVDEQDRLCNAVEGTHLVGGDALEAVGDASREGRYELDLINNASLRIAEEGRTHPVFVMPQHLSRVRDKVVHEFFREDGSAMERCTVVCTMDREIAERSQSAEELVRLWGATEAGQSLLNKWDAGLRVERLTVFLGDLRMQRFPQNERTIPPSRWEYPYLEASRCAVGITVGRVGDDMAHPIEVVRSGEKTPLTKLRAMAVGDSVPVVLEIDLGQRSRAGAAGVNAHHAIRVGMSEMFKAVGLTNMTAVANLGKVSLRKERATAIVNFPSRMAARMVRGSGMARGVFARPMFGGARAMPEGFGESTHKVVWAKVEKFSDVVFRELTAAGVEFEGLVCGERGEVGVRFRVPLSGQEANTLKKALCKAFGEGVKVKDSGAATTRVLLKNVPCGCVQNLQSVLDAVRPGMRVKSATLVGGGRYSATVRAYVEGMSPDQRDVRVDGLGVDPVEFIRLDSAPMRRAVLPVMVKPKEVVPLKKRWGADLQRTWAEVVSQAPGGDVNMSQAEPVSQVVIPPVSVSVGVAPPAANRFAVGEFPVPQREVARPVAAQAAQHAPVQQQRQNQQLQQQRVQQQPKQQQQQHQQQQQQKKVALNSNSKATSSNGGRQGGGVGGRVIYPPPPKQNTVQQVVQRPQPVTVVEHLQGGIRQFRAVPGQPQVVQAAQEAPFQHQPYASVDQGAVLERLSRQVEQLIEQVGKLSAALEAKDREIAGLRAALEGAQMAQ